MTADVLRTIIGNPALVTLSGKDLPTADVANAILKRGGLPSANLDWVATSPGTPKTVSVDWKEVPFWTAALQFEAMTGLFWQEDQTAGLRLTPRISGEYSRGVLGADTPFVKFVGVSLTHDYTGSTSFGQELDSRYRPDEFGFFGFRYYLDPQLNIETDALSISNLEIANTAEPIPNHGFSRRQFLSQFPVLTSNDHIELPEGLHSGDFIAKISGVLRAIVVVDSKLWKVPDILHPANARQVVGPLEYAVNGGTLVGDRLEIHISTSRDMPRRWNSRKPPLFGTSQIFTTLKVRDAEGHELEGVLKTNDAYPYEQGRETIANAIFFKVVGNNGQVFPGPYSLEWSLPTALRTLETPFEFHNLKVP